MKRLALLATLCALNCWAQPPAPVKPAPAKPAAAKPAVPVDPKITILFFNEAEPAEVNVRLDTLFDDAHREDVDASNITVTTSPSMSAMVLGRVVRAGAGTSLQLFLTAHPPEDDTTAEVCLAAVHFLDAEDKPAKSAKPVCATGDILTKAEVRSLRDELTAAAQKRLADKSSSEKNVFASGFVTTAGQGQTQGGADISLNHIDSGIPGLNTFLRIKKTSVGPADPRHFETGISFRSIHLFQRDVDQEIVAVNDSLRTANTKAQLAEANKKLQAALSKYSFWTAISQNLGMKFEGDPTHFQVTNAVGDYSLQFLSRTQKLFGSTKGFFRGRIIGAGFEGGRSIGTGDPAATGAALTDVNWIARSKLGAQFTAFYANPESKGPIKRFEMDLQFVHRYLFQNEVMYDATTKKLNTVGKGSRPYGEANAKLFFAEDEHARYGFRLAFTRGSLPPVFANVKSFQFGIIVETTDDKSE